MLSSSRRGRAEPGKSSRACRQRHKGRGSGSQMPARERRLTLARRPLPVGVSQVRTELWDGHRRHHELGRA